MFKEFKNRKEFRELREASLALIDQFFDLFDDTLPQRLWRFVVMSGLFIFFFAYFSALRVFGVSQFVFSLFQLNLIFSSWMVIFSFNPVYSVFFLVLVFLNGAGLLFFLGLDFLAFMFIIVYVGAIAVLFLFVVMMLNIRVLKFFFSSYHYFFSSFFVLFGFFFFFVSLLFYGEISGFPFFFSCFDWFEVLLSRSNIQLFGFLIYGPYFVCFFVGFLVLLVAVMGAISLTFVRVFGYRRQALHSQLLRDFSSSVVFHV